MSPSRGGKADGRALAFLITSQVSSGPTVGYFLFMPKVYALCLLLVVNARLRIGEQLKGHVSVSAYSGWADGRLRPPSYPGREVLRLPSPEGLDWEARIRSW